MDQRTADSLFGSGADDSDFFASTGAENPSDIPEHVEQPLEQTPVAQSLEDIFGIPANDPYGQLHASSPPEVQQEPETYAGDPYAVLNGTIHPANHSSVGYEPPRPTYGTPHSQGGSYDPYAPTNGHSKRYSALCIHYV